MSMSRALVQEHSSKADDSIHAAICARTLTPQTTHRKVWPPAGSQSYHAFPEPAGTWRSREDSKEAAFEIRRALAEPPGYYRTCNQNGSRPEAPGSNPGAPDQFLNTNRWIGDSSGSRRVTAGSQFSAGLTQIGSRDTDRNSPTRANNAAMSASERSG